jgi:hypothetical protein
MAQRAHVERIAFIRRLNAPFWIAFALVVVAYSVAFVVLRVLLPQPEIAGTLAALVLGGGAYVQREIEARLVTASGPVVPVSSYRRPWWLLFVVAIAAVWLAASFVPYAQLRGGPVTAVASNLDTLIRLVPVGVAVLVGVLVGQRADRYGVVVTVVAIAAGYGLYLLTRDYVIALATMPDTGTVVVPPDGGPPPGFPSGGPPDPRPIYLGESLVAFFLDNPLALLMPAALLGFWRGATGRLGAYMGTLLRQVTPEERQALVELAYETARGARPESAQERVGEVAPRDEGEGQ